MERGKGGKGAGGRGEGEKGRRGAVEKGGRGWAVVSPDGVAGLPCSYASLPGGISSHVVA